jgi:membrane protein DedA with SNARE-associated domain
LPPSSRWKASGFFAAQATGLDIRTLLVAGIVAAILGNAVGFWIGRRYGQRLLQRHGWRIGLTPQRIRIGEWLFQRYGGAFVFFARFLPFLRNMAASLAGVSAMSPPTFHLVAAAAAVVWVIVYGLGSYRLGLAFAERATPAAVLLAIVAIVIVLGVPVLIARSEQSLIARIEREAAAARTAD